MVQSLERAFSILGAISSGPLGLTTIAERVALPKSTVARLLGSLEELGAVARLAGARWTLGPGIAALAGAAPADQRLALLARAVLEELVAELGEDAGLGVQDGDAVRYVAQVESDNPVQVRDWTGERAPLHTVPSGLLFLAERPADALEAYLAGDLERRTRHTVTDPAVLRSRVADSRAAGSAWGREEYAEGIASVAALVRDARGRAVAALHLYGPAYRFPPAGQADEIAARVVRAADMVSARCA